MTENFSKDRLFEISLDLQSANSYFVHVSNPVSHYHRLFAQFTPKQRISILYAAHKCVLGISSRTDKIGIYVADTLVDTKPESLAELESGTASKIAAILSGEDPHGLAEVLLASVLNPNVANVAEVYSLLSVALVDTVFTPAQAAALMACLDHSERDVERVKGLPSDLMGDINALPRGTSLETFNDSDDEFNPERLGTAIINTFSIEKEIRSLQDYVFHHNDKLRAILTRQQALVSPESLSQRFQVGFEATEVYVPPKQRILVAKSMCEAMEKAENDKSALLAMSPREFEEFIAYLFSELGFEVELTKASRDGGADLLCMRSLHGVGFRLAVEVKRYKESNPITVSLVRSFVGANNELKANRLMFVTTSRYTQPAIDYATNHAAHLLALKDYDDIASWCSTVRESPPTFF